MDAIRLFDDQDCPISVKWAKPDGTEAKVDGPTRWSSTDGGVCEVIPDPKNPDPADTSRMLLRAVPEPNGAFTTRECDVRAAADADLGEGVQEVVALIRVLVQPAMADHGTLIAEGPFTRGQDPRPDPVKPAPAPEPVPAAPAAPPAGVIQPAA